MSQSIDRRQFLGRTAISGVAAGWVLQQGSATAASAADPVVVGVMGLSRGRGLAASFAAQPGVQIRYVCDTDSNRVAACVKSLEGAGGQNPQAISDFRRILDDPEVDALICAAPNHWHAPATILACSAGKHVYVEKPCCHNPQEGEWMVAAARKHNRAVQMGSQRRSSPATQQAIEKLHQGVIGRVYLARCWYNNLRPSLGTGQPADVPPYLDYELWQGPAPRLPYIDNRIHYNWHWFWHWGNGELGNNGVHTLDLCRWGLDVHYPVHVTSSGGRYRYQDDQQTPDTQTVAFQFADRKQITWQGLSCNKHTGGFVTFYGEDGALDLESNGAHSIYDARDKLVEQVPGDSVGEPEHVANFLQAIRTDNPDSLNAEIQIGHESTLLCHLGNISQRVERSLKCDPSNGHIVDDPEAMAMWQREYAPGWEPQV
jgi:predicted dehydrogenase